MVPARHSPYRGCFAVLACLLTATVVIPPSSARGQTTLRWKFEVGQTLQASFRQLTSTETTGGGPAPKITLDMSMQMTWRVDELDDSGVATISQSIERLQLKMKSGESAAIEYDSASPQQPSGPAAEVADAVAPLVGAKFLVAMNARGQIRSVRLTPEAREALAENTVAGLQSFFSAEGISRILGQTTVVLPEQPLTRGDTWEAATRFDSPLGQLQQTSTYTFRGPDERDGRTLDKIDVRSVLAVEKPAAGSKARLTQQQQSGALWFDADRGRFAAAEIRQQLTTERPFRDRTLRVRTTSTLETTIGEP